MRPERIELAGFGSFRDPTVIDLTDTDAFALVGPTGAGKSTVIDAICFALYGSVPRYDDQRLVGLVVTVGANEARVRCTFTVGARRFVAARVVRRGNGGRASTKEARLEEVLADGTTRSLAGTAKEVTAAVERVVGLPFEHFTRCVVLPQGAFARFLHDKPSDRQDLLVGLLGLDVYERVGQQARVAARAAQAEASALERRLEALAAATPAAIEAARRQGAVRTALVATVEAAAVEAAALDTHIAEARARATAVTATLTALDAVAVPTALADVSHRRDRAGAAMAEAERALKAAHEARADALARLDALGAAGPLHAAQRVHAELEVVVGELAEATAAGTDTSDSLRAATAALTAADTAVAAARSARADGERAHAAHTLAADLAPGQPCPVCRRPVDTLFVADAAPDALAALAAALDHAEAAAGPARRDHDGAARAHAGAEARRAELARRVEALRGELAHRPDRATVDARLAEHDALAATVAVAGRAEAAARRAGERAQADRAALDRDGERLAGAYHAQRDAVAALGPPPPGPDLAASWTELVAWCGQRRPALHQAAEDVKREGNDVLAERTALVRAVAAASAAAGVVVDERAGVGGMVVAAVKAEAEARHAVERLEEAAAEAEMVGREATALSERALVATELARLLVSSGFERWLVSGALDELVAGASDRLGDLSAGQYSLVLDDSGDLAVIDHANADERRPVRTLSGGETFQAALALALTLSERVLSLGGSGQSRLDAIFLDEGFGTLDSQSLDAVAAAIEALATEGRAVGVVTHVRELADRLPVRYVVAKGPTTSTVRREVG